MSAFPHLPLFTDAFIADTGHLSAQETGAYLMLMMVAWRSPECRLADNDDKLARWARLDRRTWLRIKPVVMEFWTLEGGFWTQKRLSKERAHVSKLAEVRRENGKRGGRPKSLENNDAENLAGSQQDSKTKAPIPIPIPIPNKIEDTPVDPSGSTAPEGAGDEGADGSPAAAEKPADTARARRIPADFAQSPEARAVCAEMGLGEQEADEALAEFCDFWMSEGGQKARKLDWPRTLRNRLREVGRRRPRASPPPARQGRANPYHDLTREALEDLYGNPDANGFRPRLVAGSRH
ncbi:uncharacterized protein YdaU (DUF1376 family) [Methylobacterium sp. BE186]|uniref:YdaU family protein n=1 Tax=Methylobacterium sp. BE186 TaxID=2817715 RepID=UPI002857B599|nr:DUF1376 domain-containing protein [Methylobacterium sp. BE186]MDR7037378.1 uncharacterized protein YdaU (DUF1376 family) [Methylobacterium sp. BE186]